MTTPLAESGDQHPAPRGVFYVDGEQSMRFAVSLLLQRNGCHVDTASSGHEAWIKLGAAGSAYAVLLVAWELPDMDGVHLIQKLRETGFAARVIVITSHVETLQKMAVDLPGVDAVLSKMCGPEVLLRAVLNTTPASGAS